MVIFFVCVCVFSWSVGWEERNSIQANISSACVYILKTNKHCARNAIAAKSPKFEANELSIEIKTH